MTLTPRMRWLLFAQAIVATLIVGCDVEEMQRLAREAADRQAHQNQEMIRLNREVAVGTRRLASEDAASRTALVAANQQLHAERQQLNGGWNQLESERKEIARQRREESLVAIGMREGGAIVLAILAIGLVFFMARASRHDVVSSDELIDVLLVECAPGGAWHDDFAPHTNKDQPEIGVGRARPLLAVNESKEILNQELEGNKT